MKKNFFALCVFAISVIIFISCSRIEQKQITEPDYGLDKNVSLTVVSPSENENIKPGTAYLLKWDVPSAIRNVSVALYRKNVLQSVIFESIPNVGQVEWKVPQDIFNSVHYSLKVYDPRFPDMYYSYSKNFYIKADW